MQKFTLLFILFFSTTIAFAQKNESSLIKARVKDGSIMVGGNLSGSYQRYEDDNGGQKGRLITFDFNTKSGYFFLPDFAVGLNLGINHRSDSYDSTDTDNRHTYVLGGPFVRYYWDNGLFAELNAGIGVDVFKDAGRSDLLSAAGGFGYAFFLRENVTIEPMLTFNYYSISRVSEDPDADKVRYKQFGPVLSVGLQAYLWSPTRVLPTK